MKNIAKTSVIVDQHFVVADIEKGRKVSSSDQG